MQPNLRNADLEDANLKNANLKNADLKNADLKNADLRNANLEDANLKNANLKDADLRNANLNNADLRNTNLKNVNLLNADLEDADLEDANLKNADLEDANLEDADLRNANLKNADLSKVKAIVASFNGATLTGACIEDWNINSQTNLQNVKCDYIYLKGNKQDRIPHDPDKIFAPGEFTKRYQKILETVELYFGDGIDWQVFLASFQKLQEEEKLKVEAEESDRPLSVVQTIENTGDGSFVIKVGVSPDTDKGEYEKSFWDKYQPMLEAKEKEINLLSDELRHRRKENARLTGIIETLAEKDNRNIHIEKGNYNENIGGDYRES